MQEKLSGKDKRDLAIQAGMQAIPYIGGSLATIYFGTKQERRFKRLESFYAEVAEEIRKISEQVASVDQQNKIALEALMENLHEKVEAEPTAEKRQFFKNYFKNTLRHPVTSDFDKRKYFLDTLGAMSLLECEILAFLKTQTGPTPVSGLEKPGTDQYAIVGAVGRLKSWGFLMAFQGNFMFTGREQKALQENVQVSSFGKEFCEFCLTT
jgi:hypothetical protein